jgi:hypothetical protein
VSGPPEEVALDHMECASSSPSDPPEPTGDIESEPRQRWRPKEELLRALEEARRDLKPGEEALYWDWTKTRDSAPEAEDMRPSGEGEVLVSDKEAAAAYVAPKQVAPAVAPRASTKSRIRVRPDVDPRRQPTVRNARDVRQSLPRDGGAATYAKHRVASALHRRSSPSGSLRLKKPAHPHPSDDETTTPAAPGVLLSAPLELDPPMLGPERRRRVAWAFFFGMVTGVIVFFWLRVPNDLGRGPASFGPASPASAPLLRYGPAHQPAPAVIPPDAALAERSVEDPLPGDVRHSLPGDVRQSLPGDVRHSASGAATESRPDVAGPGSVGTSNTVSATRGSGRPRPAGTGAGHGTSAPSGKAPSGAAPAATAPEPAEFLIRKKGSQSP